MSEEEKQELATEAVDDSEAQGLLERFKQLDNPDVQRLIKDHPKEVEAMVTVVKRTVSMHRGPLPPVDVLKGYESILEGAADRVVKMAEREQEHRHAIDNKGMELQKTHLDKEAEKTKRGQHIGGFVVTLCLIATVLLGVLDKQAAAAVLGGGTIVSLAIVFVLGRWPHKETKEKE